jgi:hypothetical protein
MSDLELHLHEAPDEAQAEADALTEDADLKWLMSDPRGRRIARRLLDRSGIWQPSFTGDALSSAFREGVRNAGLGLLAKLSQAAPGETARVLARQDGR